MRIHILLCVILLCPLFTPARTDAQELRRIFYGTTASPSHLPIWVAKDAGLFEKNGLNVEPVQIRGGSLITLAIITGNLQFSGAGAESVVAARASGGDVVLLACPVDADPVYLITRPEIKSAQDLKGQASAVTRYGSTTHFYLRAALKYVGLNPEKDMPLDLFHPRLFKSSAAVATLAAMGVFGAVSYLPVYLQGVRGLTASRAGMVLLFVSMAWTTGSLIAGQALNRLGYRIVAMTGMALLSAGYSFFVLVTSELSIIWVVVGGILIGTGMGLANLTTLVAVQNAVPHQRIGVATSTVMLFRTFGGAFAVSIMGTVLLNRMQSGLRQLSAGELRPDLIARLAHPQNLLMPETRAEIPPELLPKMVEILGAGIWSAFLTGFVLMLAGLAISFLISSSTPAGATAPATNDSLEFSD